jgi:hypothetical protein
MKPLGFEQISAPSTHTALTPPAGAYYGVLQTLNNSVYFRDDGVAPTTLVGMRIAAGESYTVPSVSTSCYVIQATTTAATVNVLYYSQHSS